METLVEDHDKKQWKDEPIKNGPQYLASISVTLYVFAAGTILGWTSPTLPLLMAENSTLTISEEQETWIGSLMPMGAVVGSFPGGLAADTIGRKNSMLVVGVIILASWAVLAAAQSVWYLYIGRLIAGFALGWGMTVQPMYTSETSNADIRGAMNAIANIQFCLGFLWVYSFGPYVSYIWLCILCAIIALAFLISFLFMPESPFYLVLQNDMKGATKSLSWLRGQTAIGVKKELNILKLDVDDMMVNKGTWKDVFMNYKNRKAVLMIVSLMALQQLCGMSAVLFYSQNIFDRTGSGLSSSTCTIIVGVVMTVTSLAVPYMVEKLGRRFCMVWSLAAIAIALICLGAYFYVDHLKLDVSYLTWLPLGAILIYIGANSVGLGPIPWLLMSEVFAPNIRAHGAAVSCSSSWLMTFFVTKLFGHMLSILGAHGAFWLFAVVSIVGGVLVYFFIPETKGKTLQEIQIMLNKK